MKAVEVWREDKKWSDRFLPEIKSILGLHLIGEGPEVEDCFHNTDLIVLKMEAVRIACRIRRHEYLSSFGQEFTIRCSRPNGTKTELSKIIEGWGSYFFYGFANKKEDALERWTLADLNVFRVWHSQRLFLSEPRALPGERKKNRDGSSELVAFRWDDFPENFIVGGSPYSKKTRRG